MIVIAMLLMSLLLSMGMVRLSIIYAYRHHMLDHPGRRRSHQIATPRGGGIGLVMTVLLTLPMCLYLLPKAWSTHLIIGMLVSLLLVASIGWLDDRYSLAWWPRLLVQLLAVGLFSLLLLPSLSWWWPCLILAGTWSINMHNFMDGIDGLLAQQGVLVSAGLGGIAYLAGQPALAAVCGCIAAACLGFWYYNVSPARIFMGDVGSSSLGLLLFMLIAMLWRIETSLLWPCLILCSAFVTDASLTLLHRIRRNRRWYSAHREHLYQWLVRRGYSHNACVLGYLGWNLLFVLPLAASALFFRHLALPACMLGYLLAASLWMTLKHRLVRRGK